MSDSQPDALVLFAVAIDALEETVYPTLAGAERYHARVAINALRIVQREFSLKPSFDREETAELQALRDAGGGAPTTMDMLTAQIEAGVQPLENPALIEFLSRCVQRSLTVNNPRWLDD